VTTSKTFTTQIFRDGSTCYIPIPFDPKPVFGKVRAPVTVTLNAYTFKSTIASMAGTIYIPFRKSNRQAARLQGGETLKVTLELDTEARAAALKRLPAAQKKWMALSYTRRREYVEAIEQAKKIETRVRRIERIVAALAEAN
jgi:hypothetical protein